MTNTFKEFLKELSKEFGEFQTKSGVMKFIFCLPETFFSAISNSTETVDIDKVYKNEK